MEEVVGWFVEKKCWYCARKIKRDMGWHVTKRRNVPCPVLQWVWK